MLADATRIETATLATEEAALAARREEIEALAAEKRISSTTLAAQTHLRRAETDTLSREAATLRDLLDGLARAAPATPGLKPAARPALRPRSLPTTPPAPTPTAPTPTAKAAPRPAATAAAKPLAPAAGAAVRRFGQALADGKAEGLTLATRPAAQVVAPLDARVQYSGVFRSYGRW